MPMAQETVFCYLTLLLYFSFDTAHMFYVSMESWDSLFNHKDMRAKDLKYNCHARRLLFVADAVSLHSFSSSPTCLCC